MRVKPRERSRMTAAAGGKELRSKYPGLLPLYKKETDGSTANSTGGDELGVKIQSKSPKGNEGYSTFSIRIKSEVSNKLDQLVQKSGRSRNYIVTKILESSIDKVFVVEPDSPESETSENEDV